jgi:ketosteroid isomerase-like protein
MSRENVELVRKLLEMFQRREHERVFALYDPAIEWDASNFAETIPDLAGVYHGHDGVRAYWRRWLLAWDNLEFEVQDVVDAGDQVVALIHKQRQWGRDSGIATEFPPYGIVFSVRGGRVTRWCGYPNQEQALKAAGLRE